MRRNQGSTLIVTMVVLAGLAATLAALAQSANVAAQEQINRAERAQAKQAYMDGIQNAVAILSQIVEPGGQTATSNTLTQTNLSSTSNNNNTNGSTMLTDDWAQEGTNGDVKYQVGNHYFRFQIVDACSYININCTTSTGAGINGPCNTAGTTASNTQPQPIGASDALLNNLPFQPQEIEAIEDYRSTSTTQQTLGAKDSYYQALQNPYNAKLLPFETFDELLQVEGLTAKLLYYPRTDVSSTSGNPLTDTNGNPEALSQVLTAYSLSPNVTDQGRAKTSFGSAAVNSANALANSLRSLGVTTSRPVAYPTGGFVSLGQLIRAVGNAGGSTAALKLIMNRASVLPAASLRVTTTTNSSGTTVQTLPTVNGLVNINTAPLATLEQIPGITSTIASSIVSQQPTGFLTVGDITSVGGITATSLASFADAITATSQTFIIRVIGIAGSTSIPVEAVVSVTNDTPQIISIQEMPFSAREMIDRWTWDENTTTDTVLKDNS